jgi:hypothetical protein
MQRSKLFSFFTRLASAILLPFTTKRFSFSTRLAIVTVSIIAGIALVPKKADAQDCCCYAYGCGVEGDGISTGQESSRWAGQCGLGGVCFINVCTPWYIGNPPAPEPVSCGGAGYYTDYCYSYFPCACDFYD